MKLALFVIAALVALAGATSPKAGKGGANDLAPTAKDAGADTKEPGKIEVTETKPGGKWVWTLKNGAGESLVQSEKFSTKGNAVRSAVALLANGGDKDRCKAAVGVTNPNNAKIGETSGEKATEAFTGQETAESEKAFVRPSKEIDCAAVNEAVRSAIKKFTKHIVEAGPVVMGTRISVEVKESPNDHQFFFHFKAANHKIVIRSEQYTTKPAAIKGVAALLINGGVSNNYEVKAAKGSQFSFNIKAQNNEIVGASETYVSKSNAERGRKGVQRIVRKVLEALVNEQAAPLPPNPETDNVEATVPAAPGAAPLPANTPSAQEAQAAQTTGPQTAQAPGPAAQAHGQAAQAPVPTVL